MKTIKKVIKLDNERFEISLCLLTEKDETAFIDVNGWSSLVIAEVDKMYDLSYLKPLLIEAISRFKIHRELSRKSLEDVDKFERWDGNLNSNPNEERLE